MKALHLEPGVAAGPALLGDLAAALTASARWHGTRLGRRVAGPLKAARGPRLAAAGERA